MQESSYPHSLMISNTRKTNMKCLWQFLTPKQNVTQEKICLVVEAR